MGISMGGKSHGNSNGKSHGNAHGNSDRNSQEIPCREVPMGISIDFPMEIPTVHSSLKVQAAHRASCANAGVPPDTPWVETLTMGRQVRRVDYFRTPQYKQLRQNGSTVIENLDQNPFYMPIISKYLPCLLRGGASTCACIACASSPSHIHRNCKSHTNDRSVHVHASVYV